MPYWVSHRTTTSPGGGRNVFISKYIFKSTNEVRTAKQVSSRLQQLQANTTDDRSKCPAFTHVNALTYLHLQSWI